MATGVYAVEIPDSTVQGTTGSYTVPTNFYAIVKAWVSAGGTFSINSNQVMSSQSTDTQWAAANFTTPGSPLDATSGGAAKASSSTAHALAVTSSGGGEYKIKAGDTISGSGTCKYHVELYKMPGT